MNIESQILTNAKALISDPQRWIKRRNACTKSGVTVSSCDPRAWAFCSEGAVYRSAFDLKADHGDTLKAIRALSCYVHLAIMNFNDDPDTIHNDVLSVFRVAIASCNS